MNFERGLDGMVGRMLSWLTQPPMRGVARLEERVETAVEKTELLAEEAAEAVQTAVVEVEAPEEKATTKKRARRKTAAAKKTPRKTATTKKKATAKKTAASPATRAPSKRRSSKKAATAKKSPRRPAATRENLDRFVEGTERVSSEVGDAGERILAELATSAKGLTLTQLQSRTGVKLATLRRHLKMLQDSGRVQRGKGMGTRYTASKE